MNIINQCELPKDASEDFGDKILDEIIPLLLIGDEDKVLKNATICTKGDLTAQFEYLRDYVFSH